MPMTREEKIEKVQRLVVAHTKTKEALENQPVTWDVHPGSEIASKWPVITAAYSGFEQTMKYLIAEEKAQTIAELIARRNGKKSPYETHDLSKLFRKLAEPTQGVVREFYARFQSLHPYITIKTADEFLKEISHEGGHGYARWRYALVEDKPLPRNSPEALVAVWGVCVQIAEERVWGNTRVWMPDKALSWRLGSWLDDLILEVSVERQSAGEPFRDIMGEVRDWAWRAGHPLNAFADVLWHFTRYGEHGQADTSEWLSDALTRWAKAVLTNPAIAGRTMMRTFVERARGDARDGQSVRWDRAVNRFEAVPWSLEARHQDTLPQAAVEFGDPTGTRLRALWAATKRSRYRVLENRAFEAPPNEEPWFCTLKIQDRDGGDGRPLVSLWQKVFNTARKFYMVEHEPREQMDEDLRTWIELVALKAEVQARWLPVNGEPEGTCEGKEDHKEAGSSSSQTVPGRR